MNVSPSPWKPPKIPTLFFSRTAVMSGKLRIPSSWFLRPDIRQWECYANARVAGKEIDHILTTAGSLTLSHSGGWDLFRKLSPSLNFRNKELMRDQITWHRARGGTAFQSGGVHYRELRFFYSKKSKSITATLIRNIMNQQKNWFFCCILTV